MTCCFSSLSVIMYAFMSESYPPEISSSFVLNSRAETFPSWHYEETLWLKRNMTFWDSMSNIRISFPEAAARNMPLGENASA